MNLTELEENTRQQMEPAPSAGKHATDVKRRKQATGAKRGKTCNRCSPRENKEPTSSAGKYATGVSRGKTRVKEVTVGFVSVSDWLKRRYVYHALNV